MNQGKFIISTDPSPADAQLAIDEVADVVEESEVRAFTIDESLHGERLDRALAQLVPELSRSYLQQLVEGGSVTLDGALATRSSSKVKAGSQGCVELRPTPQSQAFRAEDVSFPVVFEDEHLLIVDKPAGLVVHPAPGNWSGTILNGLLARDAHAAMLPRAGIVHRLDKDTSGLMVVARTRAAMDALVRMIAARDVSRQYLALAHREWEGAAARSVDAPIGRDPRNRLRMAVVQGGKPANTTFELIANARQGDAVPGCLVRATLGTGRTHQIRVHMAHIGHPLVADELYGGAAAAGMQRQALHAFSLGFAHPMTGKRLEFASPLPHDLDRALREWGVSYNDFDRLSSRVPGQAR